MYCKEKRGKTFVLLETVIFSSCLKLNLNMLLYLNKKANLMLMIREEFLFLTERIIAHL